MLETGEAREASPLPARGYGADGINPYLAFEALFQSREDGLLPADTDVVGDYRQAVAKGMLKVMAKMGISTLQSYKGAQIFEALGIADEVIERCFGGTVSRLQGVSFDVLEEETLRRHALGYPQDPDDKLESLPNPGEFHWRSAGERHAWDPQAIFSLQVAARRGDGNAYKIFADHVNKDARDNGALRGLLDFKPTAKPVAIDEVEPASEIVKRFCTGAMSFGSLSAEAHETLAVAMNRLGGKSNTAKAAKTRRGSSAALGDCGRSAIKEIASTLRRHGLVLPTPTSSDQDGAGREARRGRRAAGKKVDDNRARIRYSTPGGLDQPAAAPRHLPSRISAADPRLEELEPERAISVKLVSEVGVGTIAARKRTRITC